MFVFKASGTALVVYAFILLVYAFGFNSGKEYGIETGKFFGSERINNETRDGEARTKFMIMLSGRVKSMETFTNVPISSESVTVWTSTKSFAVYQNGKVVFIVSIQ